jgi:hypothetical protein
MRLMRPFLLLAMLAASCAQNCTPSEERCASSIGLDCCTAADESVEERRCYDEYGPIYTREGCHFSEGNLFTCYPPSCDSLPDDLCGPNRCNRDAEIGAVVLAVLIVAGLVTGACGLGWGLFACYKAECCCWRTAPSLSVPASSHPSTFAKRVERR